MVRHPAGTTARTGRLETRHDAKGRAYYRGKVRLEHGSRVLRYCGPALALLAFGCDASPRSGGAAPAPCPSVAAPVVATKIAPNACTLFDKSVAGWTMKEAVFQHEMVGGTPGDREGAAKDPPQWHSAMWSCISFAKASKTAWCECPRGPRESDRSFEAQMEKTNPVVWTTSGNGEGK